MRNCCKRSPPTVPWRQTRKEAKTVRNRENIRTVLLQTVQKNVWLSLGIVLTVVGAVVSALLPPLVLAKIVDTLTAGTPAALGQVLLYFGLLTLTGLLESARGSLLTVFGQKITHGLRSCMMAKLPRLSSGALAAREPGELVSRFVGDVDTVENLFSAGIISMFADLCKIVSILIVLSRKNPGLCLVLLCLLPPLFFFTRYVQKNSGGSRHRSPTGRPWAGPRPLCPPRCTISAPSTLWERSAICAPATMTLSMRAMPPWKRPTSTMPSIPR